VNDPGASTLGTGGKTKARPTRVVKQNRDGRGGAAVANYADVSTVEGGKSVIGTAVEHFGGIGIVVNNAGQHGVGVAAGGDHRDDRSALGGARSAVRSIPCTRRGRTSWRRTTAARSSPPRSACSGLMDNIGYAIAKASMVGMAKSLTVGRRDANININCIAPNAMTRISGPH